MRTAALLAAGVAVEACTLTQQGCYVDSISDRLYDTFLPELNGQTQDGCAIACDSLGFAFSGVEFGNQCFCGNSAPDASKKISDDKCKAMKCPGDKTEDCGGADAILINKQNCEGNAPNKQACMTEKSKGYGFCDPSKSIDERIDDLVSRVTVEEMVAAVVPDAALGSLCHCHTQGVPSLDIPDYTWLVETNTAVASDCIAPGKCATTFSGPMGMGASFNKTSWTLKGRVMSTEMRAFYNAHWHRSNIGADVLITGYGPNINIARDPRFGRSSELPGEDPFHSGTYATHMVTGMQEKDSAGHPRMLAYLKHFTAYSKEANRGHDTYEISKRDFFETYLPQYEMAFTKGNATGAMCSYNAENGAPSCANGWLLNTVMRGMWNRPYSHITTDCGAVHNMRGPPLNLNSDLNATVATFNGGTDLEMGSNLTSANLLDAYQRNLVSYTTIKNSFIRAYRPQIMAGRFDPIPSTEWNKIKIADVVNSTYHQQVAQEAAQQSLVLLKNDKSFLPLKKGVNLAVVGPMGMTSQGLLSDYAGDMQCFSGSGNATGKKYDCIPTIFEAISRENTNGQTVGSMGVDVNSTDTSKIAEAMAQAKGADIIIAVMGIDKTIEHEGHDRPDTKLPGLQESFLSQLLALNKPVVLILCNGGALAIDNFITGPTSIIEAFNPSTQGSKAIALTLFGKNRFGKLPVTMYPHDYISKQNMSNYDMAKSPGRTYKYYDGEPLFPFGFGMSYTTFDMSCTLSSKQLPAVIKCTIKNTGKYDGEEVVQVYHSVGSDIRSKLSYAVPKRSLINFERVAAPVGGSASTSFAVSLSDFLVVDQSGAKTQFHGTHNIIISRGVGVDVTFTFTL
eukprot:TRINITY_DN2341_c1_g1_i1.p1 TRINITY_DN2341_c1_g1~~TRINITY_DN2341_c1_g1_i1.p1  ORF type:complete len:848 (+),score=204.59 TRINITY_DN2341_c1_g1_i1:39-2582(+)